MSALTGKTLQQCGEPLNYGLLSVGSVGADTETGSWCRMLAWVCRWEAFPNQESPPWYGNSETERSSAGVSRQVSTETVSRSRAKQLTVRI